jgi:hypothetical protein
LRVPVPHANARTYLQALQFKRNWCLSVLPLVENRTLYAASLPPVDNAEGVCRHSVYTFEGIKR